MFSFKALIEESKRTGCTCWTGYKRVPGTEPCESGSCIKESERGLWDNIHAKRKRIKNGSGEKMRKPGSKGAPTAAALKASQNEEVEVQEANFNALMANIKKKQDQAKREKRMEAGKTQGNAAGSWGKLTPQVLARIEKSKKLTRNEDLKESGGDVVYRKDGDHVEKYTDHSFAVYRDGKKQTFYKTLAAAKAALGTVDEQFDIIEEMVSDIAEQHNLDPEMVWEKFEDVSDTELFEAAVDAKGHKSSTGGLTQKGRDSYNRTHGSNLKAPVTTPPSKLKAGSKAANRRKSFCARMGGMEGAMKKPNGEPTRKALALRKWNC